MKRGNSASQEKGRQIVREHGQSGLTVPEFCRKHGHPVNQFKYWKQKYRNNGAGLRFVPAVAKGDVGSGSAAGDEGLTLEVGKARIRIRSGFDRALLLQAVRALGGDE
jgi:transposase-like protein